MELSTSATADPASSPSLPARQSPPSGWLLGSERALLRHLAATVDGPFHVIFPEPFSTTVRQFQHTLNSAGLPGHIYYAKKANKAALWPRRCAEMGIGVDVSSVSELRGALAEQVLGEHIVITGPAKSTELLRLALQKGCLVTLDELDELDRLVHLTGRHGAARVLLRAAPLEGISRFGFTSDELQVALERCADAAPAVHVEGFSFHLEGYTAPPRAAMAANLLDWIRRARDLDLPADSINVGGGFAVNYVDDADWRRFLGSLRVESFHAERSFPGYYPYHSPRAGASMLHEVLHTVPAGHSSSLVTLLRRAGVRLLCEPGRALLDQAGLSVFRVQGVKDRGYGIVTVNGTSLSLSEQWFNSEFLPEPVLLSADQSEPRGTVFPACVAGTSCLETDLLSWRKIPFPRRPELGDLVVYLNTAGYQMDSNESTFHELPIPPKIVVWHQDGVARWKRDDHD